MNIKYVIRRAWFLFELPLAIYSGVLVVLTPVVSASVEYIYKKIKSYTGSGVQSAERSVPDASMQREISRRIKQLTG
jgi:hypothetical protein